MVAPQERPHSITYPNKQQPIYHKYKDSVFAARQGLCLSLHFAFSYSFFYTLCIDCFICLGNCHQKMGLIPQNRVQSYINNLLQQTEWSIHLYKKLISEIIGDNGFYLYICSRFWKGVLLCFMVQNHRYIAELAQLVEQLIRNE